MVSRGVVAALALSVLVTGSACGTTVDGTAVKDTTSPPPLVRISELVDLLVPPPELQEMLNAPDLAVLVSGDTISTATPDDGGVSLIPECVPANYPARDIAYDGSGYTGIWGQRLGDRPKEHVVLQVAALFPTAEAAQGFFAAARDTFERCAGKRLPTAFTEGVEVFKLGEPAVTGTTVTAVNTQVEVGGWKCSRAVGVRSNVVADVSACQYDATDQGERVMAGILSRVPQ
jgi:hypothetical protein